jgi:UDP-N-acetylglucosamine 2-epimerase (non-hydrolysing)
LAEGVSREKIKNVGNIMIDSLEMMRAKIESADAYAEFGLTSGNFGLITLHRPSNVDSPDSLSTLCRMLIRVSQDTPLVFPVHPRTRKNLVPYGLMDTIRDAEGIILVEPMNYIRFMNLVFNCKFVITDSGGIQEETTYLGIPCLTMRPNTERPVTVDLGTNQLCTMENLQPRH